MSRFVGDYPFFGGAHCNPPLSLQILLNRLGVEFETDHAQREAVAEWLKTNDPAPRLARELRQKHMVAA